MGRGARQTSKKAGIPERKLSWEAVRKHAKPSDAWIVVDGVVCDVSGWSAGPDGHPGGSLIHTWCGRDASDVFAAFHSAEARKLVAERAIGRVEGPEPSMDGFDTVRPEASGKEAKEAAPEEETTQAHSSLAESTLRLPAAKQDAFNASMKRLRGELKRKGMLSASAGYYWLKFGSTMALGALSAGVLLHGASERVEAAAAAREQAWAEGPAAVALAEAALAVPDGWAAAAALLMALFWQQCGWLAHDYIHHQVFEGWGAEGAEGALYWGGLDRRLGDLVGWWVGAVCQGFAVDWWKNKHNRHHAIPNHHESGAGRHDGDPDVDTMPLLAWSDYYLKQGLTEGGAGDSWLLRMQLKVQAYTFVPLLSFARLVWSQQSLCHALGINSGYAMDGEETRQAPLPWGYWEPAGLAVHYAALGALMWAGLPAEAWLAWYMMAQCAGGLLLATMFIVGHNGMTMVDHRARPRGYYLQQLLTTRNIRGLVRLGGKPAGKAGEDGDMGAMGQDGVAVLEGLISWLMGGLDYQVEHHMFPTAPRHQLPAIARRVREVCREHGMPYRCTSLAEGLAEVTACLQTEAGRAAVLEQMDDFPGM